MLTKNNTCICNCLISKPLWLVALKGPHHEKKCEFWAPEQKKKVDIK